MSRSIASLDLQGASAVDRVLQSVAAGEDPAVILSQLSGDDFGEDFGDDESGDDFGNDVSTLLAAMQGDDLAGEDFGDDVAADFGEDFGDDLGASLNKLIQAAAAGDDRAMEAISGAARRNRTRRGASNRGGSRARPQNRAQRQQAARQAAQRAGIAASRAAPVNNSTQTARAAVAIAAQGAARMQGLSTDLKKVLSRMSPGEGPKTPLPVNLAGGVTDTVAAGATVTITIRPPKDYIIAELIIPGELASRFVINGITVAGDPIFATEGFITAEQFRPDSPSRRLPHVWADGGKDIVLRATNISGAASQFFGQFLGDEGTLEERQNRAKAGLGGR